MEQKAVIAVDYYRTSCLSTC